MEDHLAERRAHIRSGTPGTESARTLCQMTDVAVAKLAEKAAPLMDRRWAIVTLGGWGAGALLPRSDLDILVLSDASPAQLKPFVEAVLYPLWDAGLKVGHQVRSPKQQSKAMREDLKTCTAALTARPIAGDAEWALASIDSWLKDARKRSRKLLSAVADRPRPGSPYLLELDLKEGAGGRRDYDELVWTAAILSGERATTPDSLVQEGMLQQRELEAVRAAAEVVSAARWELQRDGFGDTMTIEAAEELRTVRASEVQAAVAETALALGSARRRAAGSGAAARAAAEQVVSLEPQDVYRLLDAGESSLEALERSAQAGRLDALLPGFSALMTCRRPGIGHELTVGAHSLRAAALIAAPPAHDRSLARSLELADVRVAQVAALCHDTGKREEGLGHAERGAEPAKESARLFCLDDNEAEVVSELVRLHLVLPETALRGDLDDEDTILRAARLLGRREYIAPLHLLTAADSRATGASTWTPWIASLVDSLVARLDRAFSAEVDGAGLAVRGEEVRESALSAMEGRPDAEKDFVRHAPLRYLASREPAEVARDASLCAELSRARAATEALIAVSVGPTDDTHSVTVAALDRPELLARIAGAMSLSGLDILSVDAYSGGGGVALDVFTVTSATGRPVTTETFAQLERLTRAALRDRLELAVRLAERSRHYPARTRSRVSVKAEPMGWATALHVTAPNRVGLLHDIARAVASAGLDIKWARIQTVEGVARDVFHLVGPDGGPVDDPGVLGHVSMNVREAL